MTTAVLDTNALMMPVECDIRVFEELDRLLDAPAPVVPAAVPAELAALAEGAGQEATAASVGQDLAERCAVRETEADYADDAVLELADRLDAHAVTNDGPLRERLRGADVPVICLRGRNKLAVI
ncbi:MAG: rRNA-processing protein FCF1 [Natronomonas sp.]